MITFLILFYFSLYSTLTQLEIDFICLFDNVQGFNIPCANASSACDSLYSGNGIYCDSNNSIITIVLYICNFSNIIPSEIGNLPYLTTYSISPKILCDSPLSGTIPKSIGLCNLTYFGISDSKITGTIPSELMNNKQLLVLSITNSYLTGSLPSQLNTLTNLIGLDLTNNNFYGVFPDIQNFTNLGSFFIGSNKFSGSLPNVTKCWSLYIYDVSDNSFTQDIPIFNSNIMYSVDLSANKISSTIPTNMFIKSYSQLVLSMKNNLISGTIPPSLFSSNLIVFDLSGNKLSGSLPPEIINIAPQIQQFIIERNNIDGSLPTTLNNAIFPNCFKFNIANNLISGSLPSLSLYNLSTPYVGAPDFTFFNGYVYFLAHNNKLSGVVPSFLSGTFLAPTTFDLSENMLYIDSNSFATVFKKDSAGIDIDLGNIESNISYLNLQYNNITYLPDNLFNNNSKFITLKSLNLASNYIQGTLPSLFKVQYLNLERNLFTGILPNNFIDKILSLQPIFADVTLNRLDVISDFGFEQDQINFFPQDVDECFLNTSTCSQICSDGMFPLGGFTCDCVSGFVLNPIDKISCDECASTNWSLIKLDYNFNLFPKFRSLGYNLSLFDFASCDSCSNGKAFRTRSVINNIACNSVNSVDNIPCSFACSDLKELNTAQSSIFTLHNQFQSGDFLKQIIITLFAVNISFGYTKRRDATSHLVFNLSACNNINQITDIISALTLDIVPNIPQLSIVSNNCSISLISTDYPTEFPFWCGILIALFVILILILIILSFLSIYYYSHPLHYLPSEINYSFLNKIQKPVKWKTVSEGLETIYYHRKYKYNGSNFDRVCNLLNKMNLNNIGILDITAIYNPNVTTSFINQLKIFNERFISSNDLFFTKTYTKDPAKLDIMDHYNNKVTTLLDCNKKLNISIIPGLHGTDLNIAFKIAQTSFSCLSLADLGWFSKGIYFSSSVCYCLPYACGRREPAIILSYLCPGHVFPVTESHLDKKKSLLGLPVKSGYTSNYVLTKKDGHVFDGDYNDYISGSDEIVICSESQCLPAFIIQLDPESALKEYDNWKRLLPQNVKDVSGCSATQEVSKTSQVALLPEVKSKDNNFSVITDSEDIKERI